MDRKILEKILNIGGLLNKRYFFRWNFFDKFLNIGDFVIIFFLEFFKYRGLFKFKNYFIDKFLEIS